MLKNKKCDMIYSISNKVFTLFSISNVLDIFSVK